MNIPIKQVQVKRARVYIEGGLCSIEARKRAGEWWVTSDMLLFELVDTETMHELSARHQRCLIDVDQVQWLNHGRKRSIALRHDELSIALVDTALEPHLAQLRAIIDAPLEDIKQNVPPTIQDIPMSQPKPKPAPKPAPERSLFFGGVNVEVIEHNRTLFCEGEKFCEALGYEDRTFATAFKGRLNLLARIKHDGELVNRDGREWLALGRIGALVPKQRPSKNPHRHAARAQLIEQAKHLLDLHRAARLEATPEHTAAPQAPIDPLEVARQALDAIERQRGALVPQDDPEVIGRIDDLDGAIQVNARQIASHDSRIASLEQILSRLAGAF